MNPEILRSVSLFQNLAVDELELLNSVFSLRRYSAGEKILEEGAPAHEFHAVCYGTVHVRRMAQSREMLLGRISTGGFFGEMNLFDEGTITASIYAVEPVTLAVAENAALRELMAANPNIGYPVLAQLVTALSQRLRQTNERFVGSMYWSSLSMDAESGEASA